MQFSIIAVLSFAFAASASPLNVERTGTPSQEAQNQCGATNTASCCNSVLKGVLPIGIDCVALNLLNVGPVSSQCSSTQVVTCCSGAPQNNNVIAVGTVCAPIVL